MFNFLIVSDPTERWGSQAVGDGASCLITAKSAEDAKREFVATYGGVKIRECVCLESVRH